MENIQSICDLLTEYLKTDWKKICFYAGYVEESYTMKFFASVNGKYEDCFSVIDDKIVFSIFSKIDKLICEDRNKLNGNKKWSVISIVFDNNGHFKVDYDYTDIKDDEIDYFLKWKNKYLK